MPGDIANSFEVGVTDYFRDFGHRLAREPVHQAWLLMSVSNYISPSLLVAELQVPNQDLRPFGELKDTLGAVNFDFAVTRSEIDLRTWKSQTPGWNRDNPTFAQTLQTLSQTDVLAEMKIAGSTSTTPQSLIHDVRKLSCAIRFLESQNSNHYPSCYYVIHDPERRLRVDQAMELVKPEWPDIAPFPKILLGPEAN